MAEENSTHCEIHPDPFPLSLVQNKRLNFRGGLKIYGLRTLVDTHCRWANEQKKKKKKLHPWRKGRKSCEGHTQDPSSSTCLSLRLNQIIRELPLPQQPPPGKPVMWLVTLKYNWESCKRQLLGNSTKEKPKAKQESKRRYH